MIVLSHARDNSGVHLHGSKLWTMLSDLGVQRHEVYITSIIKEPLAEFKQYSARKIDLTHCLEELWQEIKAINPNCILVIDKEALLHLTGFGNLKTARGSILKSTHTYPKVVPTFDPDDPWMLPDGYRSLAYISLDLAKAIKESDERLINIPEPLITIPRSAYEVEKFLEQYSDRKLVAADIEVYSAYPTLLGLAFSRTHAISIPLISIESWSGYHGKDYSLPRHEIARIIEVLSNFFASNVGVIGQNFKFDQEKLERPMGFKINLVSDIMFKMSVIYPEFPKNLGFMTSVFTRQPYYKDEGKEFNPKRDNPIDFMRYNAKDCLVTKEIDEELEVTLNELGLKEFYYDYVMKLHSLYMELEHTGIRVDKQKRIELIEKYHHKVITQQTELNTLVGKPLNVNSPKVISNYVFNELNLPKRVDVGEDSLVSLMAATKNVTKQNILQKILEQRRTRKALSTYILARPDYDYRMRTSYRVVGTETGRTSTSVLKPPVRPTQVGLAFQTITEHGEGKDVRDMLIPDDGYIFAAADMSQAEARIVALLAHDYELLKLFDTTDVHRLTATWIFTKLMGEITTDMRFIGKAARHGGAYDMQKHRHMLEVNTGAKKAGINLVISEMTAQKNLDIFHKFSPNIRGVFHKEVINQLREDRILINPFGRRRQFFNQWGPELFREGFAHIPQSTVPDHLHHAMLRMKKEAPQIQFLKESHDGLLMQLPRSEHLSLLKEVVKKNMEVPINFERCSLSRGSLIIPAECEIGEDYGHMQKVKL